MSRLLLLLTNDDGAEAAGLRCLKGEMEAIAEVVVVAPEGERSGVGHGLSYSQPRLKELSQGHYALDGTPVECVWYAIRELMARPPDVVLSGINRGPNLGDDIYYSGTVAAAREAARFGIPALAVSLVTQALPSTDFGSAASFVRRWLEEAYPQSMPRGVFFNLNVPLEYRVGLEAAVEPLPSGSSKAGFVYTRQGTRVDDLEEGRSADLQRWPTDHHAVRQGLVSITPMHRDQTHYPHLELLKSKE